MGISLPSIMYRMVVAIVAARVVHYMGEFEGEVVEMHACSSQFSIDMDRFCSSPQHEAYFTASNNPRHGQSLTKLVCNSFGSKTFVHVIVRRRVDDIR